MCFLFVLDFILVNPIASSHLQNAPQQNYSLHPNNNNNNHNLNVNDNSNNAMQILNHFDASSPLIVNNNFNNFDPSSNYQSQYQQPVVLNPQNFQAGNVNQQSQIYNQPQFYGQSSSSSSTMTTNHQNNGPSTTYQHTINDLLIQHPTSSFQQQTIYNNQVQSSQSVIISLLHILMKYLRIRVSIIFSHTTSHSS